MRYNFKKICHPFVNFGKYIKCEPRKFPHELFFSGKVTGSLKQQYPNMHMWLKEHLGQYGGWNIIHNNKHRRLCFKSKEQAVLFKLTFDSEDI